MAHTANDHVRSPRVQWWFVVISGGLTLVCGTIGVAQYEREHPGHVDGLSPLYHAAQMLILLWLRFRREILLLRVGTWSNHWLICGLGRKGFELARHLKRRNRYARVVVLDHNPDAQLADQCPEQGIGTAQSHSGQRYFLTLFRAMAWPTTVGDQARSKRSRFITLSQAATKSCTNFFSPSDEP